MRQKRGTTRYYKYNIKQIKEGANIKNNDKKRGSDDTMQTVTNNMHIFKVKVLPLQQQTNNQNSSENRIGNGNDNNEDFMVDNSVNNEEQNENKKIDKYEKKIL